MRRFIVFIALAGCSTPRREAAPQVESAPIVVAAPVIEAPAPPPPAWTSKRAIESNGGAYVVHVEPAPDAIPDNENFQLDVWIATSAQPNELVPDVALAVDAGMPSHGHGMNRVPKITRAADGHFVVEGMLFHMTGHWELYFDITRGALTERAQVDVVLE